MINVGFIKVKKERVKEFVNRSTGLDSEPMLSTIVIRVSLVCNVVGSEYLIVCLSEKLKDQTYLALI